MGLCICVVLGGLLVVSGVIDRFLRVMGDAVRGVGVEWGVVIEVFDWCV